MTIHGVNLQDSFLNQVRKEGMEVEILLANGTLLQGAVKGFDNFTVIVQVDSTQHLVYKHAIAHIAAPRLSRFQHPGEKAEGDAAPRPATPADRDRRPGGDRRRDRPRGPQPPPEAGRQPEKFNSLDLSRVRLGADAAVSPVPEPLAEPASEALPVAPESAPSA